MWRNSCRRHSSSVTSSTASSANVSGRGASARATPSASTTPPFMSTVPGPYSRSPSRRSGAWEECSMTVSRWPSSSIRPEPRPAIRATMSVGAPRRRARHPLDLGLRRQERRAQRDRLLRSLDVARGRGHRHQRLELARGAGGDLGGAVSDELIHPRSFPTGRASSTSPAGTVWGARLSRTCRADSSHKASLTGVATPCRRPSSAISPFR